MLKTVNAKTRARLRVLKRTKFPSVIQIQTTSACNARCTCCPYTTVQGHKPKEDMSDELFKKIIDECSDHEIEKISLYLFNEPFLDKKILERLRYAKSMNPKSQMRISTNASLLTAELSSALVEVVDRLYLSIQGGITNKDYYEKTMGLSYDRMYRNVINLIDITKSSRHNLKISDISVNNVTPFKSKNDLELENSFWIDKGIKTNTGVPVSFAGKVRKDSKNYSRNIRGCSLKHRPLSHMHVVENGDVILCCMDWDREYIFGNLRNSTIAEIWNGLNYKDIINKIYCGKKAEDRFICYKCESAIRI